MQQHEDSASQYVRQDGVADNGDGEEVTGTLNQA